ncbi:MAG TPA: hypothetical protein PLS95_06870 [Thermoanaerobaculales bacterium]|nr:hypothetical protein [Thermoanaerobaculales bacterium]
MMRARRSQTHDPAHSPGGRTWRRAACLVAVQATLLAFPAGAEPSGDLQAIPNPCTNLPGQDYCTPLLQWYTSGLRTDTPKVQVRLGDVRVVCGNGNTLGSHQLAGIHVKKAGKLFSLWATSDCSDFPFVKILLDEELVRNNEPQGRIWATPNPCVIPDGEPGCKPLIEWDSLNLSYPKVVVAVNGTKLTCQNANVYGSHQIVGFHVGTVAKTFTLHEADNCQNWVPTPLATVVATSHPAGTPVCSLDDQALAGSVAPDFFGIIENHKGFPGGGPIDVIADLLDDAQVHYLRRTLRWNVVQPVMPEPGGGGDFDWSFYDNFLGNFTAVGIEPWITLSHTPAWAVDPEVECGAVGNECWRYPGNDVDWRTFVREAVGRYGPGTSYDVHNWEVWQEPDYNFNGSPDEYVDLLNAAYEEIKDLEVTMGPMTVWAPNTCFHPDNPDRRERFHAIADPVLADGYFDGFAVHTFHRESYQNRYAVEYTRHLLDSNGFTSTPLAVTAVGPPAWNEWTGEQQAVHLRDAYVCLANAGASQVMWFNATDTGPLRCDPECDPEDPDCGEEGVMEMICLDPYDPDPWITDFEPDDFLYPVVDEIGAYVNIP